MTNERYRKANKMKNYKISPGMQKELLEIAENPHDIITQIKLYNLADRSDLALKFANECLDAEHSLEGILSCKNKFDESKIQYDPECAKKKLREVKLDVYRGPYTIEGLSAIENVLKKNGLTEQERKNIFEGALTSAKDPGLLSTDDIVSFMQDGKETCYSSIARYLGIPGEEIVRQYVPLYTKCVMSSQYTSGGK